MANKAAAYEQGRVRVTELLRAASPDVASAKVPACPEWSVTDLVAHLQHVAEDYSAGRHPYTSLDPTDATKLDDPARNDKNETWADAGVAARRHLTLARLLDDWEASAQKLYRMMTDEPALGDEQENDYLAWSALGDFAIHYQDMHGALGMGGDRDAYCAKLGFATLPVLFCAHAMTVPGVRPLRFRTARGDVVIGALAADATTDTLEVDWFELYRAMAGRRSRDQIVAMLAPLDASAYIGAFTLYPFAHEPLDV